MNTTYWERGGYWQLRHRTRVMAQARSPERLLELALEMQHNDEAAVQRAEAELARAIERLASSEKGVDECRALAARHDR